MISYGITQENDKFVVSGGVIRVECNTQAEANVLCLTLNQGSKKQIKAPKPKKLSAIDIAFGILKDNGIEYTVCSGGDNAKSPCVRKSCYNLVGYVKPSMYSNYDPNHHSKGDIIKQGNRCVKYNQLCDMATIETEVQWKWQEECENINYRDIRLGYDHHIELSECKTIFTLIDQFRMISNGNAILSSWCQSLQSEQQHQLVESFFVCPKKGFVSTNQLKEGKLTYFQNGECQLNMGKDSSRYTSFIPLDKVEKLIAFI